MGFAVVDIWCVSVLWCYRNLLSYCVTAVTTMLLLELVIKHPRGFAHVGSCSNPVGTNGWWDAAQLVCCWLAGAAVTGMCLCHRDVPQSQGCASVTGMCLSHRDVLQSQGCASVTGMCLCHRDVLHSQGCASVTGMCLCHRDVPVSQGC